LFADGSPATPPAKRAWQTPQITLLDAEETETGANTDFEATGVNRCNFYQYNAATNVCAS
jgi:hypothetical protein